MVTAVIAQTKPAAKELARSLGLETRWVFGAQSGLSFIGLRVDLVLVDSSADIPDKFMQTIRRAVAKKAGAELKFVHPDGSPAE